MKFRFIILLGLSILLFSGCGGSTMLTGLSADKAKLYPLVMVADDDVVCGGFSFKKGAKFGTSDIGNETYMSAMDSMLGMFTRDAKTFPKNTILLKFVEDSDGFTQGVIVYPDGSFVFENGGMVTYNTMYGSVYPWKWMVHDFVCKYTKETPFTPHKN